MPWQLMVVAKEIDFWNTKNALGQFYHQTIFLEVVKQRLDVLQMLFVAAAGDQDVVQIHENATKASANHVHQLLKSLCSVLETKWHLQEFIQAEWSDDSHFGDVMVDRDLMITPNQVNFRVDAHACQLSQEILDVSDWIAIWSSYIIESAIVPAWVPTGIGFGYHMQG